MNLFKLIPALAILSCFIGKMAMADIHVDIDSSATEYFGDMSFIKPVLRIDGGTSSDPSLYYFPGHLQADGQYLTINSDMSDILPQEPTSISLADLVAKADAQHGTLNLVLLYGKAKVSSYNIYQQISPFIPYTLNSNITICLSVQDLDTPNPHVEVTNGACQ